MADTGPRLHSQQHQLQQSDSGCRICLAPSPTANRPPTMHNRRRSLPTKLSTFIDCFQLHSYSTKCRDLRTKANIQLTVQTFSSERLAKSQHKLTCDKNNYEDSVNNYIMCSTCSEWLGSGQSSSSRMRVINHNWSATKQCLHPQSVAEISRHSVLSGDRI